SDGATALRNVQALEQRKKRGPKNSSLNHWSEPKATVDCRSKSRWLFKCQYCDHLQVCTPRIRTFPRTLKESDNMNGSRDELQFKDEPQQPRLGNLATHTKEHAGLIERRESERKGRQGQGSEGRDVGGSHTGFTLASAKLMEKYVQDGLLNPRVEPTQPGFTRLFAAWLIEQDLPFTTGTFTIFLDLYSVFINSTVLILARIPTHFLSDT
ncbi:hypothetical protein EI94DRAFT_1892509, partial [Lactarius quietus]